MSETPIEAAVQAVIPVFDSKTCLDNVGILLNIAARKVDKAVGAKLAPWRLSPKHVDILNLISTMPDPSQTKLRMILYIDRSVMVDVIDLLEQKGLLFRRQNPDNRREQLLKLTPEGQRLREDLEQVVKEIHLQVTKELLDSERESLCCLLKKML